MVLACAFYLQLGWAAMLVPSLLLRLEADFAQTDAGFGLLYLLWNIGNTIGAFLGGWAVERLGRPVVFTLALVVGGACLLLQGLIPVWWLFLLVGVPRAIGSGVIDGGGTGLVLDAYPESRGRALNFAHLFFPLGATVAPFVVGQLDTIGVSWQTLTIASGVATLVLAAAAMLIRMPDGRHGHRRAGAPGGAAANAAVGSGGGAGKRLALQTPILVLGVAIFCYVAAEMGVSSWVVRYLADAPAAVATGALSLYWGGLMLGRIVSAAIADRFDHVRLAAVASVVAGAALAGAVASPWIGVSVALFGVVGFAFGPIFPLVMALGGERYPERAAAVSGLLTGAAIAGSIVLPPLMGFLSEAVGMSAVMLMAALVSVACAGALVAAGRLR
jgi:FHS family glucose/mannose:H+ symporter-like MFS transporter